MDNLWIICMMILWSCIWSFLRRFIHKKTLWLDERSQCDHCMHVLSWYELIPVVSWLIQRGRCTHCHKSIAWSYVYTEIRSAVIFWWARWLQNSLFDLSRWQGGIIQLISIGLIYLSLFDTLYRELDIKVYLWTLWVSCLLVASRWGESSQRWLQGFVVRTLLWILVWLVWWVIYRIKYKTWWQWMWWGDILIGWLLGLLISLLPLSPLGGINTLTLSILFLYHLLISSCIGIVGQLLQHNNQKEFWFIPYMIGWFVILTIMILFFSDYIIII